MHEHQCPNGPEKHAGNVYFCHVFPEVLLQEMVRYRGHNEQPHPRSQKQAYLNPGPIRGAQLAAEQAKNEQKQGKGQHAASEGTMPPLFCDVPPGKAVTDIFRMKVKLMVRACPFDRLFAKQKVRQHPSGNSYQEQNQKNK